MSREAYYYLPLRIDQGTHGLIDELADLYADEDRRTCPMWLAVHRAVERDLLRMKQKRGQHAAGSKRD